MLWLSQGSHIFAGSVFFSANSAARSLFSPMSFEKLQSCHLLWEESVCPLRILAADWQLGSSEPMGSLAPYTTPECPIHNKTCPLGNCHLRVVKGTRLFYQIRPLAIRRSTRFTSLP